ncbi:MBL fold metallo-hydrolase [Candidatus Puniceispirillum sp.]|nr:MBL fold metallo-hydrolase [Candidatus Puniceispirillum sp.]
MPKITPQVPSGNISTGMAELVLLGTKGGPALRNPGVSFLPTSSHLSFPGRSIIIDCGMGVTASMVASGHALNDLTDVFITHYHSDHVLELGALLHTAWTAGLSHPVAVYGPPGLDVIWSRFCDMMAFDINVRIRDEGRIPLHDLVKINVYDAQTSVPIVILDELDIELEGGLRVQALRNYHPPVHDSFALRFNAGQKSVTFSGDTTYLPALADFAKDTDILVHEAMLAKGVDYVLSKTKTDNDQLKKHLLASHSFAEDAGKIAAAANCGHLVLHHLIPPERNICSDEDWQTKIRSSFHGPCSVGYDGMKLLF